MFKKILIANRGENGREAAVSPKSHGLARAACEGDLAAAPLHV